MGPASLAFPSNDLSVVLLPDERRHEWLSRSMR